MAAYCTPEELSDFGVNSEAVEDLSEEKIASALKAASGVIDSYLRNRYTLPLVAWGSELRRHCAIIAAYDLISGRGYNPQDPGDTPLRQRYEDTIKWLEGVSDRDISPDVTDSSASPGPSKGVRARAVSNATRGWQETKGPYGAFTGRR